MIKHRDFVITFLLFLMAFPLSVAAQLEGDVQGDGVVDVADIAALIFSNSRGDRYSRSFEAGSNVAADAAGIEGIQSIMARRTVIRAGDSGKKQVLKVDDVAIKKGETANLVIYMDYETTETVCGINFSLYLPDGILLDGFDTQEAQDAAKASALKKACDLGDDGVWGEDATSGWLSVKQKTDGGLLFVLIDQDDKTPFVSTKAKVLTIKIKAIDDVSATGTISGIAISSVNNVSLDLDNIANTEFEVGAGGKGDVQEDGVVDVADITAIWSVMGGSAGPNESTDVNGDGVINIADVSAVISTMTGKSYTGNPNGKAVLTADPVAIGADGTGQLVINMNYQTTESVAGWNFSLYLPEELEVAYDETKQEYLFDVSTDLHTNAQKDYVKMVKKTDGGFLVYYCDENKTPMSGTVGTLISITVKATSITNSKGAIKGIALTNALSKSLDLGNIADAEFDFTMPEAVTIIAQDVSMTYGGTVPELTYTVSGGTVTGVPELTCEASGNSDVGEYVIKVEKGTVVYPNLVLVNGTLTVTQAQVDVTAKSYTISETEALPTFEAEYIGWKNGQDESVLTKKPTLSCSVPNNKAPGTYHITVDGAEAKNYSFSYTNGTLTITQAPTITVKAEAKEMTYGDDVPQLTYTVSGGTLTGEPVLSTTATSNSDAGEYDITIEKGTVSYPRLVLEGARLTVKKAELTVNAGTYTMKQNEPRPAFQATYSGWRNGDTEAVLTKQPTFTTNAPDDNTPGEYTVTVDGAEAKNYDFKYEQGKLVITEADAITIVADDVSMTYGGDVPELTYTVSGGTVTGVPELTCEASGNSDVGEYVIKVEKGTVVYPNLVLVNGTLTVTQAQVDVTAKSYTISETEALPTFEAEYIGWKNGQDESVLTKKPTLSCSVPNNKAPGTYHITVDGAEAKNYSFSYTNGTLTITQAPTITVKAEAKEMTYGDDVPQLTYTVSGGTLTGEPVLSTTATSNSDAGEYDITIEKGTVSYPRLVLEGARLTVKKAELTVNAGTYTMKQNEPRPAFQATYSGWRNGDTEAVLTKQPTFTTNAPDDNTPGEYTVTVDGAEAKNYDFKYEQGKLVITEADAITIVADDVSMTYGGDVPELTYTVSGGTVTGEAKLVCAATETSDVGEYEITIDVSGIDYPNIVTVNGKLTITQTLVTVTARSYTISETDALPTFEAEYSGFRNGQDESVLTTTPTLSCNVPEEKTPGEYTITVSGAEAKNYSFTYANGKLTVTKADVLKVDTPVLVFDYATGILTITCSTEGSTIHYTINGDTQEYSEPITLTGNNTVTAWATAEGYTDSDRVEFTPISDLTINEDEDEETVKIDGPLTDDELDYLIKIMKEEVEHLDLEDATLADDRLGDEAFAGMNIITVRLPKTIRSVGARLFTGCRRLAAVVWNAATDITAAAMESVDNPNLLLYVNSENIGKTAGVRNRVVNLTAKEITLSDPPVSSASDCNFYCPVPFKADSISYSHEYTQQSGINGVCRGWETIALPFTAERITHMDKGSISPFGSPASEGATEDEALHFWLYGLGTSQFEEATQIEANKPYIICMPQNDEYIPQYRLGGNVIFSATGADVPVTVPQQATANDKTLHANFIAHDSSDGIYTINIGDKYDDGHLEGSIFLPNRRALRPFEAYSTTTTSGARYIELFDRDAQGIVEIENEKWKKYDSVYDLSGRRVTEYGRRVLSHKRLMIKNGKLTYEK